MARRGKPLQCNHSEMITVRKLYKERDRVIARVCSNRRCPHALARVPGKRGWTPVHKFNNLKDLPPKD